MDRWERAEAAPPGSGPAGRAAKARGAVAARQSTKIPSLPADVATEIRRAADAATAHHREVLVERMEKAVAAYQRGRFQEAMRYGNELTREVASVPAVRRLAGFAAYRSGRGRDAARHLGAYTDMTDEPDAVPALMDSLRALGRHAKVAAAWNDLRHRSPDADILAEARMVAAGSLADRGRLPEAVELLVSAGAARALRNPSDRHLRQWYALADLYERAGDLPRARELFQRVARVDVEAYDVVDRLDALGPASRRPRRPSRATPARSRAQGSAKDSARDSAKVAPEGSHKEAPHGSRGPGAK
jgi:tetratricopeptide (TPR) repeat protein